jgi:hypothetical protein
MLKLPAFALFVGIPKKRGMIEEVAKYACEDWPEFAKIIGCEVIEVGIVREAGIIREVRVISGLLRYVASWDTFTEKVLLVKADFASGKSAEEIYGMLNMEQG